MKTVLCTLPNASENINGIAFERLADGSVQARMPAAQAAQFEGIAGYAVADAQEPKAAPPRAARAKADSANPGDKAPQ